MLRSNDSPADPAPRTGHRLQAAVAALVACVGIAAVVGARSLGYWVELGPGPGFFPLWLGVILAALGAGWLAVEVRTWRSGSSGGGASTLEGDDTPAYSPPTMVAIVVSLCALAALLEVLGYQLSMLLFLLFHLLVLGRRAVLLSTTLAVAGSFGVFVIFTRLLSVPLPASSIPLLRDLGF